MPPVKQRGHKGPPRLAGFRVLLYLLDPVLGRRVHVKLPAPARAKDTDHPVPERLGERTNPTPERAGRLPPAPLVVHEKGQQKQLLGAPVARGGREREAETHVSSEGHAALLPIINLLVDLLTHLLLRPTR